MCPAPCNCSTTVAQSHVGISARRRSPGCRVALLCSRAVPAITCSLILIACRTEQPTSVPAVVASVAVTPFSSTVAIGESVGFTAMAHDADGQPVIGRTITWISSDPAKLRVTSAGVATATASGDAAIIATVDGVDGDATVVVAAVVLATAMLGPDVQQSVRGVINEIRSGIDVAPATAATRVRVLPGAIGSAVAATSSSGALLLMGVERGGIISIDAHSSGIALLRLVVLGAFPYVDADALDAATTRHPEFTALVTKIRQLSESGVSFLGDDDVLARAIRIALAAIPSDGRARTNDVRANPTRAAASTVSTMSFPLVEVDVDHTDYDVGKPRTTLYLANHTFLPWEVRSVDDVTGVVIEPLHLLKPQQFDPFAPPFYSGGSGTTEGANTRIRLELSQSQDTRKEALRQIGVTLIGAVAPIVGVVAKDQVVRLTAAVVPKIFDEAFLTGVAALAPEDAAVALALRLFDQSAVEAIAREAATILIKDSVKDLVGEEGLFRLLRDFLDLYSKLSKLLSASAYLRSASYVYSDYGPFSSVNDRLTVCEEEGYFVRCVESLRIEPSAISLPVGGQQPVSLPATYASGTEVFEPPKLDFAFDPVPSGVASLITLPDGSTRAVRADAAGVTRLTIRVPSQNRSAAASVTVTSQVDPPLAGRLTIEDISGRLEWPVSDGSTVMIARLYNADGSMDEQFSGPVCWTTSDVRVLHFFSSGQYPESACGSFGFRVYFRGPGIATVTGTARGLEAKITYAITCVAGHVACTGFLASASGAAPSAAVTRQPTPLKTRRGIGGHPRPGPPSD